MDMILFFLQIQEDIIHMHSGRRSQFFLRKTVKSEFKKIAKKKILEETIKMSFEKKLEK